MNKDCYEAKKQFILAKESLLKNTNSSIEDKILFYRKKGVRECFISPKQPLTKRISGS